MNPQQPSQPQRPGSEYDFFMNPDKASKPRVTNPLAGGNSMAMRLIVVLIGLFILIILFVIGSALLNGNSNKPKLIIVAQDQNEIVRVAGQANTTGNTQSSQTTKNFAASAALSIQSEQQQLLAFMDAHGGKPSQGQLLAAKDASTDAQLSNAAAASNFDSVFNTIMHNELKNYQAALQAAYNGAKNSAEKQLLSDDYDGATLLLKQLGSPDQ